MTDHPITPPPELVEQWKAELPTGVFDGYKFPQREQALCIQAARWGADQELEACCEWAYNSEYCQPHAVLHLRDARRPKTSNLKEQALEALKSMQIDPVTINGVNVNADVMSKYDTIRRALEALDD